MKLTLDEFNELWNPFLQSLEDGKHDEYYTTDRTLGFMFRNQMYTFMFAEDIEQYKNQQERKKLYLQLKEEFEGDAK